MKAAYIDKFGGPEVLKVGDLPDPKPAAGQVVVDVAAASINAADYKVRAGDYKQTSFPLVLGRDFSGTVSAVGAAVVAKKPALLSHADAAALALTGLTAICAVEEALKLKKGETILIQGGAGGVASFAIQLAKHIGARVITTASASNHDYVRKLG